MAKEKGGITTNEGHDDSSTSSMPKPSKGMIHQVGSAVDLASAPTSVNQKSGHTGTGEE